MVEAWRDELTDWLAPFVRMLGDRRRARMCPAYVEGLIGPGDRKSVQPMAMRSPGITSAATVSVSKRFTTPLRREEFYHAYRNFCDHMRIRSPLEAEAFYKEVRRIADQEPDCAFKAQRTKQFNGWVYCGPKSASVVSMHVAPISLLKGRAA